MPYAEEIQKFNEEWKKLTVEADRIQRKFTELKDNPGT